MISKEIQAGVMLVAVIALITFCTIYSNAAFMNLSVEANNGTANATTDSATLSSYTETYSWIYIIGILLVVAAVAIAFRIAKHSVTDGK